LANRIPPTNELIIHTIFVAQTESEPGLFILKVIASPSQRRGRGNLWTVP